MKIAFILNKKTPHPGRFFCGGSFLIGFGLLFAAWMMPLHFPPWLSWHSEMLAFVSMLLMSGALIKHHFNQSGRSIVLPKIGWPMGLLCTVVAIQVTTGQIAFVGDALVLIVYLLLCLFALTVGYSVAVAKENGATSGIQVFDQLAVLLVLGGVFSVIVALVQTLDIWESASYIARMHDLRRPGGNVGQPNQLATLILFSIASVVYLFESGRVRAVTAVPISALLFFGLAITESRSGLLGLVLLAAWGLAMRRRLGFSLSARAVGLWLVFFACGFALWPTCFNFIQEGGWTEAAVAHVNTSAGTRLVVWPQLWQAALMHPWVGWGLREVSTAHNAVVHAYAKSEAFTYAHNLVLDLAVGVGLPLTTLLVAATAVWLWRRVREAKDIISWYCLAVAVPFGVHSMLEYPFTYAYLLVPVMFLLGVLEARQASAWVVRAPWWTAAMAWGLVSAGMAWSVVEYINIEEDFRVVRFEAMRMGQTPSDYERPKIVLLTQLDALLEGARIVPVPGMKPESVELAHQVAVRFPWPATQNRYALSLALNGNTEEAIRQLKVMRAMHGEKTYAGIKSNWEALAKGKYPQLGQMKLP